MTDETPGVDFPILLFDGHCNLCNGWVKFVLAHEKDDQVRFAPLQSNLGQSLLQKYGLAPDRIDTVVLIRHGRQFVKSTGALKLMSYLNFPWRLAQGLVLIPRLE